MLWGPDKTQGKLKPHFLCSNAMRCTKCWRIFSVPKAKVIVTYLPQKEDFSVYAVIQVDQFTRVHAEVHYVMLVWLNQCNKWFYACCSDLHLTWKSDDKTIFVGPHCWTMMICVWNGILSIQVLFLLWTTEPQISETLFYSAFQLGHKP